MVDSHGGVQGSQLTARRRQLERAGHKKILRLCHCLDLCVANSGPCFDGRVQLGVAIGSQLYEQLKGFKYNLHVRTVTCMYILSAKL